MIFNRTMLGNKRRHHGESRGVLAHRERTRQKDVFVSKGNIYCSCQKLRQPQKIV